MHRSMLRAVLACLALSASLWAWDWPLKNPETLVDFASNYRGGFLPGLMLVSDKPTILAVQDGELILSSQEGRPSRQRFPLAFGGTLVVEHLNGMRSVYTGFPSGLGRGGKAISGSDNWRLKKGDVLGRLPSDSQKGYEMLFFRLIDYTFANAVNPMVVLPNLADERVPIISAAQIQVADSALRLNLSDRLEIPQASFSLFVQLHDKPGKRQPDQNRNMLPALPYEIKVIWNGALVYESYKLALRQTGGTNGQLSLIRNKAGSFGSLYQPDGFVAMGELKLQDGMNRLEIRAADLNGNRTSASYRLTHTPHLP